MFIDFNYNYILPNLIVGSYPFLYEHYLELKNIFNVSAIISLQSDDDLYVLDIDEQLIWKYTVSLKLKYQRFPVYDFNTKDLLKKLPEILKQIIHFLNNNEKIYLHCTAGINRSPTVACCYLILKENITPEVSVELVKKKRPIAEPHLEVLYSFLKIRNSFTL